MLPIRILAVDEITEKWDKIRTSINKTVGEYQEDAVERNASLLNLLIARHAQVFASEDMKIIIITQILHNMLVKKNILLIYSAYSDKKITKELWEQCREVILLFARNRQCSRVLFYTANNGLVNLARRSGAAIRNECAWEVDL